MCFDLIETKPRAYEQEDTKSVQLSLNCSVWRGLVCCVLFQFIIHMLQTKSHPQRKTWLSLFSRGNPVASVRSPNYRTILHYPVSPCVTPAVGHMLVFPQPATHVPPCTARLRGIPGAQSALAQVTYFSDVDCGLSGRPQVHRPD